jgi:hypothetical protein
MSSTAELPVCNALWIGGNLSPISRACLASFVRHGHEVVLHVYERPSDAPPDGVRLADAATTIPAKRVFRHKQTGSYALFANLFRYELLRRDQGIWIDCDLYCVRPIDIGSPYVFGWEWRDSINNAVLGMPPDCPILDDLIGWFDRPSPLPPWLDQETTKTFLARKLKGEAFGVEDLPWASLGPRAVTWLLTQAGLAQHAQPRSVFYPVIFGQPQLFLKSGVDLAAMITAKTRTIHLWNENLHRRLDQTQPGSAIHRLIHEGRLFDESALR